MSIIAFSYFSATQAVDPSGINSVFPNVPVWLKETYPGADTSTESFYYTKFPSSTLVLSAQSYTPDVEAIDYTANPTNKEFWFRYLWRDIDNCPAPASDVLATFYNYNGSRYKQIAALRVDTSYRLVLDIYSTTEGSSTITNTQVITTSDFFLLIGRDPTTKDRVCDIRIMLDNVAGFVQLYDKAATKVSEYLGNTWNTLALTHIGINTPRCQSGVGSSVYAQRDIPVFAIAADEPTFSMYVVPMFPKTEGTLQDQNIGTSVSNIAGRKITAARNNAVSLTAAQGITKQYTCNIDNMTDRSLPANYIIKSFKVAGIFEADSAKSDIVPVNFILRDKTTTIINSTAVAGIVPNLTTESIGNFQRRQVVYKTNPLNSSSWAVTDFANIEVGFSFTGV